jgi:hypothetical protein
MVLHFWLFWLLPPVFQCRYWHGDISKFSHVALVTSSSIFNIMVNPRQKLKPIVLNILIMEQAAVVPILKKAAVLHLLIIDLPKF